MNICPKCGTKGEVKFCPECGTEMIEEMVRIESNIKICPNCGYEGEFAYCPECGKEMVERVQEEQKEVPMISENQDGEKAVSAPADEDILLGEEIVSDALYENVTDDSLESDNNEQLTGWKFASDGDSTVKNSSIEDPEKKEKRKKKRKKILKIVGIVVGIIVLAFVALIIIGTVLQDSLDHDMDNPKSSSINTLKYQYPDNWVVDDSDSGMAEDDYVEREKYIRWNKDDNTFMARMQIYYLGDDLSFVPEEYYTYLENQTQDRTLTVGDTDIEIKEYDTELNDTSDESVSYDTSSYVATFEKDYSDFFIIIDAMNTAYDADMFDQIIQSIDVEHYKNPRTAKKISAVYEGGNTPGTEIGTGDSDVVVTVEYTNGDKESAEEWELNNDIIIEEGKTNEATVSCHGLTCKLEVTGRKPVELKAEYDGKTKAGTKIGKKDLTVTVKYDNGEKEKVTNFDIDKSVKLKAGETSTIKVKYGDLSCDVSVECTTLSESQYKAKCVNRNYKDQLRKASYDKYIKIYGQVLQDCGLGYYRISSSGGYDDVYMVYAPDSDIVEDDWCTVYGKTAGIYEYETVMGASQKVPEIEAKYVDR